LVTVATLMLALLLIGDRVVRDDTRTSQLAFRAPALTLIGLLFAIIASALHRMWLYMQVYGLTELRVYTSVFMLWLAVVFGWFALTVLRGRSNRFAFGFVVSGLATALLLNLANPVGRIVAYNIERIVDAQSEARLPPFAYDRLDAGYLASLAISNADAHPPLLANLSQLSAADRCQIMAGIVTYADTRVYALATRRDDDTDATWPAARAFDWRAWNLARENTRAALTREVFVNYRDLACAIGTR
jgi:hypothetical protein